MLRLGSTMRGISAAFAIILVLIGAPVARAQEAPSVTVQVLDPRVDYPASVKLTGAIAPAGEDQSVEIWSAEDGLLTIVSTDPEGGFGTELFLEGNDLLYAVWGDSRSEPVEVQVRPKVEVELKGVRLFSRARVVAFVEPDVSGLTLKARLLRNGRTVASREIVTDGGLIRTSIRVTKPGRYRVRVVVDSPDHAPGRAATDTKRTRLPRLGEGSAGPAVKALETHLGRLGYHLDGIDRRFDYRTADAVRAFNKVQGRPREGHVGRATWRALASPVRPKPAARGPRFHIEVDQTKQVLYVVRKGKVADILHVSTGAGSATRDGVFHVHRKLAGYSANRLYYPSYFDGLRAIHGWNEVPTYNASHGCVRVPMWSAQWIYGLADIGTEIRIYH